MAYITNSGVKIYYETHGQGKPLVLMRGLSGSIDGWITYLDAFTDSYQIILVENRGVGKSDKPDTVYHVDDFADDISLVLDDLGIEKTAILGLSMGGFTTLAFFRKYPQRVKAIILGCTGPGLNDPQHVRFSKEVEEILWADRDEGALEETTRKYLEKFFHEDFRNSNPRLMEQMVQSTLDDPQPAFAYKRQLEACYTAGPSIQTLEDIKVPALILHGTDDVITPLGNAFLMAQHIKNAELFMHIFQNAGHMFFIEKKAEFIRTVRDFLDRFFYPG